MKKHLLLCSLVILVMLASCKKNDSAKNTGIEGTFTLKYLTSQNTAIITSSTGERIVNTVDYTTTNNRGTIAFNNSILTATGLSYSVDTEFKLYHYNSTGLVDSISSPYLLTVLDTIFVDQFRLIGADSIYFPQGSVITRKDEITGDTWRGASGGRYSWNGNLLTIIQHFSKDTADYAFFDTARVHITAVAGIVMEKQ